MSSEAVASSKTGRRSEAKTESLNTPSNTTLAPASNTPTTPSADTTSSTEASADPPKPAGRRKTTPQSQMMSDILGSLRRLSTQIEQLSDMIGGLELHHEDNNMDASTPSFSILKKGDRNRGPVGRRSSKVSSGGQFGGPWKPLVVKVCFFVKLSVISLVAKNPSDNHTDTLTHAISRLTTDRWLPIGTWKSCHPSTSSTCRKQRSSACTTTGMLSELCVHVTLWNT